MKHTKTEICSTGVGIGQNQKTWLRFTFFHFEDVCRKVSYLILPRPPPLFFFFLAAPHGLWDLSSPTRDWTQALGIDSAES